MEMEMVMIMAMVTGIRIEAEYVFRIGLLII